MTTASYVIRCVLPHAFSSAFATPRDRTFGQNGHSHDHSSRSNCRPARRRRGGQTEGMAKTETKPAKAKKKSLWKTSPDEHDYPAAYDYLSLLFPEKTTRTIVRRLR